MSIRSFFKARRLASRARRFRRVCEDKESVEEVVDAARAERKFSLVQKREEIIAFTRLVEQLRPKTIVDIGSSGGGTIRLFSHFAADDARIFSVDIENTPVRQKAYPHLIKPRQQITVHRELV